MHFKKWNEDRALSLQQVVERTVLQPHGGATVAIHRCFCLVCTGFEGFCLRHWASSCVLGRYLPLSFEYHRVYHSNIPHRLPPHVLACVDKCSCSWRNTQAGRTTAFTRKSQTSEAVSFLWSRHSAPGDNLQSTASRELKGSRTLLRSTDLDTTFLYNS